MVPDSASDGDVYAQDEGDCKVDVISYSSDSRQVPVSNSFKSASMLSDYLSASTLEPGDEPNRVMFVGSHPRANSKAYYDESRFLHQQDSWDPLSASKGIIEMLKDHFELSSGFLRVLTSFRFRHLPTEEAFSGSVRKVTMHGRSGRSVWSLFEITF